MPPSLEKTINSNCKRMRSTSSADRYEAELLVPHIIPVILVTLTRLLAVTNQIKTHKYIEIFALGSQEPDPVFPPNKPLLTRKYHILLTKIQLADISQQLSPLVWSRPGIKFE